MLIKTSRYKNIKPYKKYYQWKARKYYQPKAHNWHKITHRLINISATAHVSRWYTIPQDNTIILLDIRKKYDRRRQKLGVGSGRHVHERGGGENWGRKPKADRVLEEGSARSLPKKPAQGVWGNAGSSPSRVPTANAFLGVKSPENAHSWFSSVLLHKFAFTTEVRGGGVVAPYRRPLATPLKSTAR